MKKETSSLIEENPTKKSSRKNSKNYFWYFGSGETKKKEINSQKNF